MHYKYYFFQIYYNGRWYKSRMPYAVKYKNLSYNNNPTDSLCGAFRVYGTAQIYLRTDQCT